MKHYIEEAIGNIRQAAARYAKSERYYRGDHDLAFASAKFANTFGTLFREFAMNLCPAVCDAVRDKLRVTAFVPNEAGEARAAAAGVWHRNRMAIRAGEVHREALVAGDAYAIVWPDETGRAAIYPQRAGGVSVVYDEERPGRIERAAKLWRMRDGRIRLNIFFPDRIERYVTRKRVEGGQPEPSDLVAYVEKQPDGTAASTVANPFGTVPVFHFANNGETGAFGRSELEAAIPVQDGLNKAVLDMLVAMEFCSYRQRWAAGIEIAYDGDGNVIAPFKAGIDHIWVTQNPDARFGDFNTADLDQFLKVKDSFRIDMASVTGTPMYYLLPHTRGFPSGEALLRAESRFIAKVRDRQLTFGRTWADAMEFALRVDGIAATLETEWEDPTEASGRDRIESVDIRLK